MRVSLVVAALSLVFAGCPLTNLTHETYRTGEEARNHGAYDRDMVPRFVPIEAENLSTARNHATGASWMRCELPPAAIGSISAAVQHVGWQQARNGTKPPPGFFGAWNPVLGQPLTYTPDASAIYFVYREPGGEWHGVITIPVNECFAYRLPS
jgi:hypothetical protein